MLGGGNGKDDVDEYMSSSSDEADSPVLDAVKSGDKKGSRGRKPSGGGADAKHTAYTQVIVSAGDRLTLMAPKSRGKPDICDNPAIAIFSAKFTVEKSPPSVRSGTQTNTVVVWVPGQGPRICTLGVNSDGSPAVMVIPSSFAGKKAGLVKSLTDRPMLPQADCETAKSVFDSLCRICRLSGAVWIMRNGLNSLLEAFTPETNGWDAVFSPKTPEKARELLDYLWEAKLLTAKDTDARVHLDTILMENIIVKEQPKAAAKSRSTSHFTGTTVIITGELPHLTIKMPRKMMSAAAGKFSTADLTVPLAPGGAKVFTDEQFAAIKKAAEDMKAHGKAPYFTISSISGQQYVMSFTHDKKAEGTAVVFGGQRLEGVVPSMVKYFDYPADVVELATLYPQPTEKTPAAPVQTSTPEKNRKRKADQPAEEPTEKRHRGAEATPASSDQKMDTGNGEPASASAPLSAAAAADDDDLGF